MGNIRGVMHRRATRNAQPRNPVPFEGVMALPARA
jgi:hypothetical protein